MDEDNSLVAALERELSDQANASDEVVAWFESVLQAVPIGTIVANTQGRMLAAGRL